jgi:D-lactate dehydrogenase (cytochrome)
MTEISTRVKDIVRDHGGKNFEFSASDKEAKDLWQGRKAALWGVMALKPGAKVWTTDVW